MARMVHCVKLGREAEGLDRPTYPGDLGKRIYENVSKEAWQGWLRHQTMLVNETASTSPMRRRANTLSSRWRSISSATGRTPLQGTSRQKTDRLSACWFARLVPTPARARPQDDVQRGRW